MSVGRPVAAAVALVVLAASACSGAPEPAPRSAAPTTAESTPTTTSQAPGGTGGSTRPVVTAPEAPAGWRVETWHYLTLNVPDTFGYGAPSQWCIARPRTLPRVMRPRDVHTLVGCHPAWGYGVTFLPADVTGPNVRSGKVWRYAGDDRFPRGSWVATVVEGRLAVQIVTAGRSVTEQIAASVRRADVDGNGCRTHVMLVLHATHEEGLPVGSLCRYTVAGWLERSERLSADDLAAARAAFAAAPDHPGLDHCVPPRGWLVVVRTAADELAEVAFDTVCGDGVSLVAVPEGPSGEDFGRLTAEVMHWALSPGWAQVMRRPVPWPAGSFR